MKLLKSKGLLLALVLTLALPVVAFAQTDENNTTTAHENRSKITDHVKKKFHHTKDHLMFGVHKQMYMQLLAEKYTPEQTNEWDAVFTEREQLKEQLKELKTIKKEEMKYSFKEEMEKLREKVENGELTKQEAKNLVKEKLKERYQEKKQNHEEYHEKNKELMNQFTEAIAAEDAEMIKSTLPQLLEVFKAQNERMKEVIASISN